MRPNVNWTAVGAIAQFLTVFVAGAGLFGLWRQVALQNKLTNAQLLRDRFEMYWRTYEPITNDQLDEFEMDRYDFMDENLYQSKYKGNPRAIKKYIMMGQLYEYLAFVHTLQRTQVEDPLGPNWLTYSVDDKLKKDPDEVFSDVCNQYRMYYPDFASFVAARKLAIQQALSKEKADATSTRKQ